jgi:cytochrome c2
MARDLTRYSLVSRLWHGVFLTVLIGVGGYLPYAAFKVKPFPTGNLGIAAPAGVTSHDIVAKVTTMPTSAFEADVKARVYKWCGFCHTMTKNGEHLLGPNLYGIFGQRAGTTPNYINYSSAMIAARDKGLVWNDATIASYIANPDVFMPGTNMAISIGPITDPATRAAVINLLKRDTMAAAATQALPQQEVPKP